MCIQIGAFCIPLLAVIAWATNIDLSLNFHQVHGMVWCDVAWCSVAWRGVGGVVVSCK